LYSGRDGLAGVPTTLERVLAEGLWRDRVDTRTHERFVFDHFVEFVTTTPPAGLGATVDLVQRIVRGTPAERLLFDALRRKPGRQPKDAAAIGNPQGWTTGYLLGRLHRDHPALFARVEAGEITAYAASVEAGLRPRKTTIRVDTPENAVRALLRRFTAAELRAALDRCEG
jgi:hypothetical protein